MDFSPDLLKKLSLGMGGASVASGLFGGGDGRNPADAASSFYSKVPGTVAPYYNPYITAGQKSMNELNGIYGDLMKDPGSMLSTIGKGYTKSPGFDFERNEGLNAINNSAAAGGMLGTPEHQENAGRYATEFANHDFGEYLRNALGLWGKGLSGKEGISDTGFKASTGLADLLGGSLMSQGNLAYEGEASKNRADASNRDSIFSGVGQMLPFFLS